jgi:hypothetical protein
MKNVPDSSGAKRGISTLRKAEITEADAEREILEIKFDQHHVARAYTWSGESK